MFSVKMCEFSRQADYKQQTTQICASKSSPPIRTSNREKPKNKIISVTMLILIVMLTFRNNLLQADSTNKIHENQTRQKTNSTIGKREEHENVSNNKYSLKKYGLQSSHDDEDNGDRTNNNNQISNIPVEKSTRNPRTRKNLLLPERGGLNRMIANALEFNCREKLLELGADLLAQHLRILSQAAEQLLSEKSRSFVSQIFIDNLHSFTRLHCRVLNDAFHEVDRDEKHALNRALGAVPVSGPDEWLAKIIALATEAFGEVVKAPEEGRNASLNLNETAIASSSPSGVVLINSTSSSSPSSLSSFSGSISNGVRQESNVREESAEHSGKQDARESDIASSKPGTNLTTINPPSTTTSNISSVATASMTHRNFKVMAGLRTRGVMLKLNKSMKIRYSEYVDNYSKRLLVFENESHIIALVGASRYHLHGTSIYLFTWALLVVILMGNCYILISTRSCRRRRSNVNFFIVHLAIADLLVGIFSMCSDALIRYLRDFTFGYPVCVMYKYLSVLFIFLSTYMLVALGFDRREAVVYPLQFASNRNRGAYLVSGAWALSALLSSPILFLMQVVEVDSIRQCNIVLSRNGWKIYVLYMLGFVIIIPSTSLIIFYSQIVRTINKKYRQAESMERRLERDLKQHHSTAVATPVDSKSTVQIANEPVSSTTLRTIEDVGSSSEDEDETAAYDCDDDFGDDDDECDIDSNHRTRCNVIESLCGSGDSPERESVDVTITIDGSGSSWANKINTDINKTHDHRYLPNNVSSKRTTCQKAAAAASASLPRHDKTVLQKSHQHHHHTNGGRHSSRARPRRLTGAMINRQHGKSVIPKARLKTIQMTIAIVIAFLVCWLPFYVVNIISIFNLIDQKNPYWDMLMSYTNISCYLNSAMNPVLYFWFSRNNNDKTKTTKGNNRNIKPT